MTLPNEGTRLKQLDERSREGLVEQLPPPCVACGNFVAHDGPLKLDSSIN